MSKDGLQLTADSTSGVTRFGKFCRERLGVSTSTGRKIQQTDPDFPITMKLSEKVEVLSNRDGDLYVEKLKQRALEAREQQQQKKAGEE